MRIGYVTPNSWGVDPPRQVVELAVRAEERGVDSLWVSHHVLHRGFVADRLAPQLPYHDPLVMLATFATATSRARLGTSVLVVPYLHPLPTAKALATVDHLSAGRVDVGVGVGALQVEHDSIGQVPFDQRGRYADEFLAVLQCAWAPGPSSFEGRFFAFDDLEAYPGAFEPGGLPVYVGGHGGPAQRRAARHGAGWHGIGLTPEQVGEEIDGLRRAFDAEGRTFDGCPFQLRLHVPVDDLDVDGLQRRVDAYAAAGVTELALAPQSGDVELHRTWVDRVLPALTHVDPGPGTA